MAKRKIKKCFQIFVYLHTYVHYTYIIHTYIFCSSRRKCLWFLYFSFSEKALMGFQRKYDTNSNKKRMFFRFFCFSYKNDYIIFDQD